MKICLLVLLALAAVAIALPVEGDNAEDTQNMPEFVSKEDVLLRTRRATCDLLSHFVQGHTACATHCILRGHRGGYCNNKAVCVCRN